MTTRIRIRRPGRTLVLGLMLATAGALQAQDTPFGTVQQLVERPQDKFDGSIPQGKATDQVIDLSIQDAIDRGLKYNLGAYLSAGDTQIARAARLEALSAALPQITGDISEEVQKINLAALGFSASTFGGAGGLQIPSTVGPFSVTDVRARMQWSILDFHNIDSIRAASQKEKSAKYTYTDARESVVMAVGANYLLTSSAESRLQSAKAQLETAKALYQLATDQEKAGIVANIDTLRSQVEVQAREQTVLQSQNNLEKQRISLARVIGLPIGQKFRLANEVPYSPFPGMEPSIALSQALQTRPDYLAAVSQLKAAELSRSSAWMQHLPSVNFTGDYGVIGLNPGNLSPSWSAAGMLKIPIFEGGKIRADVMQADAQLNQQRARVNDLKARIEQDVVNATLDLNTAAHQVEAAKIALDLANQVLEQAHDRFAAGITNNIEVIQAQESLAANTDQYLSSVYSHNIAKVLLARAIGNAEQSVRLFLGQPGNTVPSAAPATPAPAPGTPAPSTSPNQ